MQKTLFLSSVIQILKSMYKKLIMLVPFLWYINLNSIAQDAGKIRYQKAYQEMEDMLSGKQVLSIKRAVFIAEWAYLDGILDYDKDFCQPIAKNVAFLKRFIEANKLEKYKTAKQIALCDFFFRPWSGNGYTPFTYDYSKEFPEDDWHYQLVSRTLRNHKGQCRSLPWTFKLLAEELGATAYLAHLPNHCFIMYKDEDDLFPEDWVNVEITSHQYVPTFWNKEHFEVKDSAISVGTYLTPLTDKQTIACQLADLAFSYYKKYHVYDEFTLKCVDVALQYYPMNPNAIIIRGKSLDALLLRHLQVNGHLRDTYTDMNDRESRKTFRMLHDTYWTQETPRLKEKWTKVDLNVKPIIIKKK